MTVCFRRSEGVDATEGICKFAEKPRSAGVLGRQKVRRERRAVAEPRCGGSIGVVLGVEFFLREGGLGCREGLWDSRIRGWSRLMRGVPRTLGSEGSGGARMCAEECSLAGHIEGCPRARRRVSGILRAVLRHALRPTLRTI